MISRQALGIIAQDESFAIFLQSLPAIETSRLKLLPIKDCNLQDYLIQQSLFKLHKDPNVIRWFSKGTYNTLEKVLVRMEKIKSTPFCCMWFIFSKIDMSLLGYIILHNFDVTTKNITLGIDLLTQYHGNRYAAEAARAAIILCFDHTGINSIIAEVNAENKRCLAAIQKYGLAEESITIEDQTKNELLPGLKFTITRDSFLQFFKQVQSH